MDDRERQLRLKNNTDEIAYLKSIINNQTAGHHETVAGFSDGTQEPEIYHWSEYKAVDSVGIPIESLCWVEDHYELLPEPHNGQTKTVTL